MVEQYHFESRKEDWCYVGICKEFPSIIWMDNSLQDAYEGIREVVTLIVEDMTANGEVLPTPRS